MSAYRTHGLHRVLSDIRKWKQSGFTLLEFTVVSIVVALLSLFFFDRALSYQETGEKTAVETTAINMRAGLRYRVTELLLLHRDREIAALIGGNPVKWLDTPPAKYLGELNDPRWEDIPPGSWYFDTKRGEILYRVKRARHFVAGPSQRQALRFRVTGILKAAASDPSILLAEGVTLSLVEQYKWF